MRRLPRISLLAAVALLAFFQSGNVVFGLQVTAPPEVAGLTFNAPEVSCLAYKQTIEGAKHLLSRPFVAPFCSASVFARFFSFPGFFVGLVSRFLSFLSLDETVQFSAIISKVPEGVDCRRDFCLV